MGLSTADRNRRKRERKKKQRAEERSSEEEKKQDNENADVEIEYVAAELPAEAAELEAVQRFQARLDAAVVSEEDVAKPEAKEFRKDAEQEKMSKRKLREIIRPSVADLKRKVARPDLVEAHDVTATDPEFLIRMKAVPGSVPVPRHWGRKRKYLQGKRGFEKPHFRLPQFLIDTGIAELRDTVMAAESEQSAKQKNRARVAPKMGAIDVDYKTLHDAFFKHQTKPFNLTKFGDLYYEGKETEVSKMQPGRPLSAALRAALGMTVATAPPPWLINMQRYGPPPSYPNLPIPGLNAPLPDPNCQYGYHSNGWGKPPVDAYGRPLYGGNPFDPPGTLHNENVSANLVTSDGKTLLKEPWGALPTGIADDEEEEDESSEEELEESEEEEEEEGQVPPPPPMRDDGLESILPPPPVPTAPVDLRKTGMDTPVIAHQPPKQLYTVIDQKQATASSNAVFASEVAYAVPSEGAESVLSKAAPAEVKRKAKKDDDDDDDEDLGKNFKF